MPKDDLPRTGAGVTTEAQLHAAFQAQQAAFEADPVPSLWARRDALDRLRGMLLRHTDRFIAAISDDFGQRAELETRMAELNPTLFAIRHARQHLGRWMRPRRVSTDIFFWPGRSRIHPQPVGVVGVISPWNYPLFLTLSPLIAAISAGNRAILKPSEFSPAFSALLHEAIADTFSAQEVTVALGGADVA
ncbi:MAG: aldehyde dehydrogenase family protein, partial [Pseudomonadota bacterium]